MPGLNLKKHFSINSSDQVQQICNPVLSLIGVSYFNYIKIYNDDSSRELLTNNPDWIEHFYKNSLYNSVGAVDIEHLLPKGYFLWSELDSGDAVYTQGRESFNIDNGVSFVIRRGNVTYLYIFASTRENHQINNFYIRNVDLFKRFIHFFNDKAQKLIKEAEKNRIYLPQKQIIEPNRFNQINVDEAHRAQFYKSTEMEKFYLLSESDNLYLTRKQAECAAYVIEGATAKECAKELGISHRTVEEHVSDIKEKISNVTGNKITKEEMIKFLKKTGFHDAIFANKIVF